ncbi:GNAT family N-acetyltransferase [Pseudoalteromonas luteoviolacea]|uniref:GNAT family N-acetyltransferase n=1 Tax=Pseudoalteromonas luteoviolacea TaxID=43657 RepID=UPI001B3A16EC|nr:GNAT family N-acetyltransferase [Pseudoalteromonas luteoviolacea]MBQ4879612.1 GNAT family N-acetyltransferase [Pseudoalteromonas luteoviolacea]MBQ4909142.1 GNAT family N-acetyltransferase [Pseudoalteromonas luteoviolacea]
MQIRALKNGDLQSISKLVADVSNMDILPHFCRQGQDEFISRVIPDLEATMNPALFKSIVATELGQIIGFGAIREKNYITHVFVSKNAQGKGVGKALVSNLVSFADGKQMSLRASINARSFYEGLGFSATEPEGRFNGIRFIPMSMPLDKVK